MGLESQYPGMADEEIVSALIDRAQRIAYPKRIRTLEFFRDFDKLRCGRCTANQFGRALATAKFKFSEAEVAILCDHFDQSGKPGVGHPQTINYFKFAEAVDEVFAADNIDVNDSQRGFMGMDSPNATLRASMTSFVPKEVDNSERVMHILHRLAALCKSRGIVFKYQYADYERPMNMNSRSNMNPMRGGKVRPTQFKRAFPFKKEIADEDIDMLMARYATDEGDINFQAIHNDVSEVLRPEPPPCPTSDLYLKHDPTQWEHMSLHPLKKLQAKVVEMRVRLKETFMDFDALRKGVCTQGQLKTALTILKLDSFVSRDDYNQICEQYTRDDGMFIYKDFCDDINSAFATPGLEKDPLAITPMPDHTSTAAARRNRISIGKGRTERVAKIMKKLRARVARERLLMKPTFKDMDKTNNGLVTRDQFCRIMGMLGWGPIGQDPLSQEELADLCAVYTDRGNHNDFNYYDFLEAIDPPDEEQEIAMMQLNSPYQDEAPSKYFDGRKVIPFGSRAASPLIS